MLRAEIEIMRADIFVLDWDRWMDEWMDGGVGREVVSSGAAAAGNDRYASNFVIGWSPE